MATAMEVDGSANANGSTNANGSKEDFGVPSDDVANILSAIRGATHGMSIDILYVELGKKKKENEINKNILTELPPGSRTWEVKKIEALMQVLADRLYQAGHILFKVGLRKMEPKELMNTEWTMRVDIVE